jgi:type II pantothenate kinase
MPEERSSPRKADWQAWLVRPRGHRFALAPQPPDLPGLWDLTRATDVVPHWTAIFRANARFLLEIVAAEGDRDALPRAERAVEIFEGLLRDLDAGAAARSVRTVHAVTLVREHLLRGHDLPDAFRGIKAREAGRVLLEAPAALERAWELGGWDDSREALVEVLSDLLAGNLFDLGSRWTQEAFRAGDLDIAGARRAYRERVSQCLSGWDPAVLERLQPRPRPLDAPAEGRVLLFADNAGADFLLGILPAAVFWARRWEVVVVVNSLPASSDIAIQEARAHWSLLGALPGGPLARVQAAGRLSLIESGTGSPGIDLRFVGAALNGATPNVHWILLEGQGRAIETNWATSFVCPVLRAAVVKDPCVAEKIHVRAGEPQLRWDEAHGAAPGDLDKETR